MKKLLNTILALSLVLMTNFANAAANDRYLKYDGVEYKNHVKLIQDNGEDRKTCVMVRDFYIWVKENYEKNPLDPQNDNLVYNELNKQFYEKMKQVQLRLVKGLVNNMYCQIHEIYYPNIKDILDNKFKNTKYEVFSKSFAEEEYRTYVWIMDN